MELTWAATGRLRSRVAIGRGPPETRATGPWMVSVLGSPMCSCCPKCQFGVSLSDMCDMPGLVRVQAASRKWARCLLREANG